MAGLFLRTYATTLDASTAGSTKVRISIRKASSGTFATGSDWSPASGDVKVSKDGGSEANIGTLPAYSNGQWEFVLSGTELTAKNIHVRVSNAAVDDEDFNIETFGNASAMYPTNYEDGVRLGMTALPSSGTLAVKPAVTLASTDVTGNIAADLQTIKTQTVTASAGVTFPTSIASPTNITAGTITTTTNLTNAPTSGDFTAAMKTSLNAATPASVVGAVGSVTGNVGGNVVGSVASVTAGVTVSTNNDKTGYTLTQAFPTNFSALAITVGGAVTAGTVSDKTGYTVSTVSDKTGYALTAAYDLAKTASQAGDAMTLTSAYDAAKSAAQAGDAMALTTDERTATATAVWASATRTLTSFGTLINDIWAFAKATVAAMATTTIGRYLYDTVGSGGGSTTVNVLPVASTVSAGEVTGTSLIAYQNQTITYTFGIVDSNGDPVDLSTKAVAFYAALKGSQNTPIITRDSDGNGITIGGDDGNSVAVALTDTHTASIANYVYSLWNTTDDMPLAKGQLSIQAIPQEVA